MREIYSHLAEVSGADTIVDTSKHPADAAMLGRLGHVRPFFLHLVRDWRAVTNSWRRHKEGIARRKVPLAAMDWLLTTAACDAIRRRYPERSMLLRYYSYPLRTQHLATVERSIKLCANALVSRR
jgi:hypothetical protein